VGLSVLVAVQGCTDTVTPAPPIPFRQRAPISNYRVPTSRPTFRWFTPHPELEHTVTICADRDCQRVEETLTVRGNSAQPGRDLPRGVHFWRVTSRWENADRATPVWQLRTTWDTHAEVRGADRGDAADYNGDGYSDIVLRTDERRLEILYGGEGGLSSGFIEAGVSGVPARSPSLLGAADLNGDGFDDLAIGVPAVGRDRVVVFHGGREGLSDNRRSDVPSGFPQGTWFVASTVKSPRRADLDQDGFDDLLLRAGPAPNGVHYTLGNAVLWHEEGQVIIARPDGTSPLSVPLLLVPAIPVDVTLDGVVDLVVMKWRSSSSPFISYDGPLRPFPLRPFSPEGSEETERPFPLEQALSPINVCDLRSDRFDDFVLQRRPGGVGEIAYPVAADGIYSRSFDASSDLACVEVMGREVLLYPSRRSGFEYWVIGRPLISAEQVDVVYSSREMPAPQSLVIRQVRAGNVMSRSIQSVAFLSDGQSSTHLRVGSIQQNALEVSWSLERAVIREVFL
jgi:hypothetical protein